MHTQTAEQPQEVTALLSAMLTEMKRSRVPDDLWTLDDVAVYLKKSRRTVERVVADKQFPRRLRLPTSSSGSDPLWVAKEVRAWALKCRSVE